MIWGGKTVGFEQGGKQHKKSECKNKNDCSAERDLTQKGYCQTSSFPGFRRTEYFPV